MKLNKKLIATGALALALGVVPAASYAAPEGKADDKAVVEDTTTKKENRDQDGVKKAKDSEKDATKDDIPFADDEAEGGKEGEDYVEQGNENKEEADDSILKDDEGNDKEPGEYEETIIDGEVEKENDKEDDKDEDKESEKEDANKAPVNKQAGKQVKTGVAGFTGVVGVLAAAAVAYKASKKI